MQQPENKTPKQFQPKRKMYLDPSGKIVWFLTAKQASQLAIAKG